MVLFAFTCSAQKPVTAIWQEGFSFTFSSPTNSYLSLRKKAETFSNICVMLKMLRHAKIFAKTFATYVYFDYICTTIMLMATCARQQVSCSSLDNGRAYP